MSAPRGGGLHRLRRIEGPDGPLLRREWHPLAAELLGADFRVEVEAQRLAAAHGLAPPVLAVDFEDGWVEMPWVEGRTLEPDWLRRPARRAALHGMLERLRRVPAARLPTLDLAARATLLHRRLAERAPEAAGAFADGLAAACAAWRPWSGDATGVDAVRDTPCLVHGDPTPGNVLIRPDGTLLLLDWEYAQAGGPWDDLAALVAGEPDTPAEWSAEVPSDARPRFDAALRLRRLLDALWHALRAGIPVDA